MKTFDEAVKYIYEDNAVSEGEISLLKQKVEEFNAQYDLTNTILDSPWAMEKMAAMAATILEAFQNGFSPTGSCPAQFLMSGLFTMLECGVAIGMEMEKQDLDLEQTEKTT